MRMGLIVFYFLISLRLIYRYQPDLILGFTRKSTFSWLSISILFFGFINIFYLGYCISTLLSKDLVFENSSKGFFVWGAMLSILALDLYIFLKPERIYGFEEAKTKIKEEGPIASAKPVDQKESEVEDKPEEFQDMDFDEAGISEKIHLFFEVEQVYLNPNLMVADFGKMMKLPPREVTQILNNLYGHSFKELVNMYRVSFAKQKIEEGFLDQFTLDSLGGISGFSSRTTFFNVFKKELGVSPNDFWKKFQKSGIH